jgi:CheY-like chemotaxis protein/HPt (histidine-containing phosphotransfer) domain-containing protein
VLKSRTAAASLLDILNGILDFSKIEAGKLDLEAVPFPLETLLRELSVIVSSSLGDKELEVLYDVDPRVPAQLVGDPLRLKQVLINLCGNAVKFTQGGEIIVEVKPEEQGSRLKFSVIDTGLGISPEQKVLIFHAFSQADVSTSRRFGGTGLGLTISQRLVRMMGGTIDVDSEPGKGSRFSFSLALPPAQEPPPAPAPQRVLMVSRNPAARRVLAGMARAAGWPCEVHPSVAEAEKSLNPPTPWTVAVVDLWTVEAADWMACTRLRQTFPSIRVLGLVNLRQLETVRASASAPAGFHGFLVKPFTVSMLAESAQELAVETVPAEAKALPRRLEGARLLLAEDNPFNQQVGLELLEREGALVSVACDGAEAVRKLTEAAVPFDAVLMDMRMPGMDGLEATRLIRRTLGMTGLPIIAMTANALPSDKAACFEAGMDDHIAKPIERDKLVETLSRFVRRSEPAAPVFDGRAALERLGNDPATLDKVLAFWLQGSDALGGDLEAARDTESLIRYFHSLKGSAATVGGTALSQFAAKIERLLIERPQEFQLEPIARETHTLVEALRHEIDAHLRASVRAS